MNKEKKDNKKEPYLPFPYRKPNKIVKIYDKDFEDAAGNKAIITCCDFYDKKNKLKEGYELSVKWLDVNNELNKDDVKSFIDSFHLNVDEKLYSDYNDGYLSFHFYHNNDLYFALICRGFNEYFVFKTIDNKPYTEDFFNIDYAISTLFLDKDIYEECFHFKNICGTKDKLLKPFVKPEIKTGKLAEFNFRILNEKYK